MKLLYRFALLVFLFLTFCAAPSFAQTISIINFDNTIIYSPGSSIAVPFHIDNSSGSCISQTNTFNLYLSDANGNYSTAPLATVAGFYATYINAVIPAGTPAGTGYKVKITATSNPSATIVDSAPFTIAPGAAIQAAITPVTSATLATGVFGKCDKTVNNEKFDFLNASNAAATNGTVSFFDELNGGTTTVSSLNGSFIAQQSNYTILVKATNGFVTGTKAFTFLNNNVSSNIGSSSSTSGCLSGSGSVVIAYTLNVPQLQNNYPGITYKVTWGDGSAATIYTLCDLIAAGGTIMHTFTKSSCGNTPVTGKNNVFEVDIQPTSPFCGPVGTVTTTYANITLAPVNRIGGPTVTCAGAVTLTNGSYPGEDPGSTSNNCKDFVGALYTWYVDGVPKGLNYGLTQAFQPILTSGNHVITLHLNNNPTTCTVNDVTFNVCVQNAPTPDFSLSSNTICSTSGLTITNNSTFDNTCKLPVYNWTVTAPTGAVAVTTIGGTDLHSAAPQFVFTTAGIYTLTLSMPDACGVNHTKTATVKVDSPPFVTLAGNVSFCGIQNLTFNNIAGSLTRTIYTGAADAAAATYNWVITASGGATAATFINSTTAASQYPSINFPGYGSYNVTVTYTNSCGTASASQTINIQHAPFVNAGTNASICAADNIFQLNGSISDMTNVTSYKWKTSGDGSFDNTTSSLTPVYTLGANDKKGGNVTLTLDVKTSLVGICGDIPQSIILTVTPPAVITSTPSQALCSGNALNYTITSNNTNSTFAWTATAPANITGFTASGTGNKITDVLINTDPANSGVVIYTITPTANGCPGVPFNYSVMVNPIPVIALTDASICSAKPTAIALNGGLKYTWTSAISSGFATGYTQQITPANITAINDILNNPGTTPAVIKYIITPISASGCAGLPVSVNITVQPLPTQPAAMTAAAVCNATSYKLSGTVPLVGSGQWAEASGKTVTFADASDPNTIVSGLQTGIVYNFTWTISTACYSYSATLQLTNDSPSIGGTAAINVSPICYGSGGTVTLSGNVGNVIGWQQSIDGGNTWQTLAGNNTATTYNYISLTKTTAFRAIVVKGSCTVDYSVPVTVIVNVPTTTPNAGTDQTLCNQSNVTLQGNDPGVLTGKWTLKSGQTGVIITDPSSPTTTVTGLQGGSIYIFTWTINGQPPCGNLSDDVVITDQSAITNTISLAGSNTICAGSAVNILGSTPTGGTTPYTYLWESSIDNGATWNVLTGQTGQNIAVKPMATTIYRRTVYSNQQVCSVISNQLTINTQPSILSNTIAYTSGMLCNGSVPDPIVGSVPTGGDGLYFYRWQQSADGGVTYTDINGATGKDYQPPAITVNTTYQRLVSTSLCSGALGSSSNPVTITVSPALKAVFTAKNPVGCAPFLISSANITATSDPNAKDYTWYAGNLQIGTGIAFPGYTITSSGATVPIKLVVSSKIGCPDAVFIMDFSTSSQATASFTIDRNTGCGPQTINFVNTSTPVNSSVFTWSFGDGTPDYTGNTPPVHTFQPDSKGNDVTYTITLTAQGCAPTVATNSVTVYASKPVAVIDPGTKGCAPYAITVKNLSLGTNSSYTFYLYDENNKLVQTISKNDKSDVVFDPVNATTAPKIFTVNMIAVNLCGVSNKSNTYPVTITPTGITSRMSVTPVNFAGVAAGCAPFLATFNNLATGGSSYVYNIYDGNNKLIESVPDNNQNAAQNYNFSLPGTYYVSISVFSDCSAGIESPKVAVTVYPVVAPAFTSDAKPGCTSVAVNFTNNTPGAANAPAQSYNYLWDFGDGTTSNVFSPTHVYDSKKSPYTVTLTATNANGCSAMIQKADYITVSPPPKTEFTANPDTVIAIPNYTFNFIDKSNVTPVTWFWDFGDKTTSTRQNPSHTYTDTGYYKVTLTTYTPYGCTDTKTHIVRIKGIPGQLYVPNAFIPSSLTEELRRFTVKGSGIKEWTMRIFNNWGQMVFQTSKLNSLGEPVEFWDGKFNGKDVLQGAYAWEISATFLNGTDWKGMSYKGSSPRKAGTLNLIR